MRSYLDLKASSFEVIVGWFNTLLMDIQSLHDQMPVMFVTFLELQQIHLCEASLSLGQGDTWLLYDLCDESTDKLGQLFQVVKKLIFFIV